MQGRGRAGQRGHRQQRVGHGELLDGQHPGRHAGRGPKRDRRRGHLHEPHPGGHRGHRLHADLRLRPASPRSTSGRRHRVSVGAANKLADHDRAGGRAQRRSAGSPSRSSRSKTRPATSSPASSATGHGELLGGQHAGRHPGRRAERRQAAWPASRTSPWPAPRVRGYTLTFASERPHPGRRSTGVSVTAGHGDPG